MSFVPMILLVQNNKQAFFLSLTLFFFAHLIRLQLSILRLRADVRLFSLAKKHEIIG